MLCEPPVPKPKSACPGRGIHPEGQVIGDVLHRHRINQQHAAKEQAERKADTQSKHMEQCARHCFFQMSHLVKLEFLIDYLEKEGGANQIYRPVVQTLLILGGFIFMMDE